MHPLFTAATLQETQNLIAPHIHRTPVFTSRLIDAMAEASLFFKCENLQRMGAFKIRGANSAVLRLTDAQKQRGVLTHSSGNFAQALALAGSSAGVQATIVMPENAPAVKKDAVRGYGGIIVESESTPEAREALAARLQADTGATFIHPSNDALVILGQGTSGLELIQDYPDLDNIVVPVGGGGLIAGCALAAHYFGNRIQVYGAEPAAMDDAYRSLRSGKIERNPPGATTIADGLRTNLGDINFPVIQQYVHAILRVEEHEIAAALKLIWERMKIIVEPSSAITLAAVLGNKDIFRGTKTGLLLSGGNVDLKKIIELL